MGKKYSDDRSIRVYMPPVVEHSKVVTITCEGCGESAQVGVSKLKRCQGYTCGKLRCARQPEFILPTLRHPHFYSIVEHAAGKLYGYTVERLSREEQQVTMRGVRVRVPRESSVDRWGLERHHKKILRDMFRGDRLYVVKKIGYALGVHTIRPEFMAHLISKGFLKTSDENEYFMTEKGQEVAQISFFAKVRDPREWLSKKDHPEFNRRLAETMTKLRDKGVELTEVVVVEVAQNVLSAMRTDGFHHRKFGVSLQPENLKNQFRRGDILRKNTGKVRHRG